MFLYIKEQHFTALKCPHTKKKTSLSIYFLASASAMPCVCKTIFSLISFYKCIPSRIKNVSLANRRISPCGKICSSVHHRGCVNCWPDPAFLVVCVLWRIAHTFIVSFACKYMLMSVSRAPGKTVTFGLNTKPN